MGCLPRKRYSRQGHCTGVAVCRAREALI
jgi:hypothetical protein